MFNIFGISLNDYSLTAFKKEDEKLEAKRKEALEKMEKGGRISALKGGPFSRNNLVLRPASR